MGSEETLIDEVEFNQYIQCFDCATKDKEIQQLKSHIHELVKMVQESQCETVTAENQTEPVGYSEPGSANHRDQSLTSSSPLPLPAKLPQNRLRGQPEASDGC